MFYLNVFNFQLSDGCFFFFSWRLVGARQLEGKGGKLCGWHLYFFKFAEVQTEVVILSNVLLLSLDSATPTPAPLKKNPQVQVKKVNQDLKCSLPPVDGYKSFVFCLNPGNSNFGMALYMLRFLSGPALWTFPLQSVCMYWVHSFCRSLFVSLFFFL